MKNGTKLRRRRERALNDLAEVIRKMWGDRCPRHDGHCACCVAWTVFDAMDKITDAAVLDFVDPCADSGVE